MGAVGGNRKGRRRRFGAIRKLPSGRYQVRYLVPETGLMRSAPQTFGTVTDADVWLTVTEAEMHKGTWIDPDAGRVPLGEYAARWIAERPGLAPRTVSLYSRLLAKHIEPKLGAVDLVDLTPARIRTWRKGLLDNGVGPVTVAKCYRLLRSVLSTAVEDDELIRRNPCRIKGAGGGHAGTPGCHARAGAGASGGDAVAVAGAGAAGRVIQSPVGRADGADPGRPRPRRPAGPGGAVRLRGRWPHGGRAYEVEGGCTDRGLPAGVIPVLRAHLAEYSEKSGAGRVFVGVHGATMRRSNFAPMWAKAIKRAGLAPGFRFHDLRHTGNTWAAGSGANLRELMERMGHSSTRAALIYLHAASDGHERIAEGIDRKMTPEQDDSGADEGEPA